MYTVQSAKILLVTPIYEIVFGANYWNHIITSLERVLQFLWGMLLFLPSFAYFPGALASWIVEDRLDSQLTARVSEMSCTTGWEASSVSPRFSSGSTTKAPTFARCRYSVGCGVRKHWALRWSTFLVGNGDNYVL